MTTGHWQQQAARFARIFAFTLLSSAIVTNAAGHGWKGIDRQALAAAVVAALEAAYRQVFPAQAADPLSGVVEQIVSQVVARIPAAPPPQVVILPPPPVPTPAAAARTRSHRGS